MRKRISAIELRKPQKTTQDVHRQFWKICAKRSAILPHYVSLSLTASSLPEFQLVAIPDWAQSTPSAARASPVITAVKATSKTSEYGVDNTLYASDGTSSSPSSSVSGSASATLHLSCSTSKSTHVTVVVRW